MLILVLHTIVSIQKLARSESFKINFVFCSVAEENTLFPYKIKENLILHSLFQKRKSEGNNLNSEKKLFRLTRLYVECFGILCNNEYVIQTIIVLCSTF